MKTLHRLFAAVVLALIAPFLLVVPAHAADEPDPLTACQAEAAHWKVEAAYWKGDADAATASELRAGDRALAAEGRAEALSHQLGQRTAERDRLRGKVNRLTAARASLQAEVADLRAELRGEPTSH